MIYKVFLIDAATSVILLEVPFKELQKTDNDNIFSMFFKEINRIVKDIRERGEKDKNIKEKMDVVESDESIFLIYFQPLSKILFCSISDLDDDTERIKDAIKRISHRFMKKHRSNLKLFRATTTEKVRFETFIADIENFMYGGRIAEVFPKLLIAESVLDKIQSSQIISEFECRIALQCDGNRSPFRIAKNYPNKTRTEINEVLKKLEQLDIIKI